MEPSVCSAFLVPTEDNESNDSDSDNMPLARKLPVPKLSSRSLSDDNAVMGDAELGATSSEDEDADMEEVPVPNPMDVDEQEEQPV
jgi:hypothetical protein